MKHFYKAGIDITNDKQMFNFLKNHFTYRTVTYCQPYDSIANNVKLYNLNLSGDWCVAFSMLENGAYENIDMLIEDWCKEHTGYNVTFNGRSGGYLALTYKNSTASVLPDEIIESEDYEEYKSYCHDIYNISVKANRSRLVECTKLVQDFDKLCDQLRDYCDELSNMRFELVTMQEVVDKFNYNYTDDLEYLEFQYLSCDADGCVDLSEITQLACLKDAFKRTADRSAFGYILEELPEHKIRYKRQ